MNKNLLFICLLLLTGIEVNCWSQVANPEVTKRSVVHLETDDGTCNGVLLNNSNKDGRALILTAGHCVTDNNRFLSIIFGRDYILDNTPYKSVEWSSSELTQLQLSRDLDYALFELSAPIPEYLLPYYAGWESRTALPISSYGIHSPATEKIFIEDLNRPKLATFNGIKEFGGNPVSNGTFNIIRWETGFTAAGSSGSPLFNQFSRVTGILSGGSSSESNPSNDFYSRFDLIFMNGVGDWLESGTAKNLAINGMDFQQEVNNLFKNVNYESTDRLIEIVEIDLVSETFLNEGTSIVKGVYLTLDKIIPTDIITISIISNGVSVHEQSVFSGALIESSENFIQLSKLVEVSPEYSIEVKHNRSLTFPVITSAQSTIKLNGLEVNNRSLMIGILSEGSEKLITPSTTINNLVYPNPSTQNFYMKEEGVDQVNNIKLFTSKGDEIITSITEDYLGRILIDMSGYQKGIYLLQYQLKDQVIIEKLILL